MTGNNTCDVTPPARPRISSGPKAVQRRFGVLSGITALSVTGVLTLIATDSATAQLGAMVNPDGAFPVAGLVLAGNTLYGAAQAGGSWGHGAVFSLGTDGTEFSCLHNFMGSDGMNPYAPLIVSSNSLYGTANCGGGTGSGTVFAIDLAGSNFWTLHNFDALLVGSPAFVNNDGAEPYGALIEAAGRLFGTTEQGGASGEGSVFAMNADGTGFTNLHSFTTTASDGLNSTNNEGSAPQAGLVLSAGKLYGTAVHGGTAGNGTIFMLESTGAGFTNLYNFSTTTTNEFGVFTNSDGAGPVACLILSGAVLYGTAPNGGSAGNGTVFAINTDGTGFRILHSFSELELNHTNTDGAVPHAGLVLSGDTLYGAAEYGGNSGNGAIFALKTDGTGFTNLYSFSLLYPPGTNGDGTYPYGTLIVSGDTLYGTALFGGDSDDGTVFSLKTDGTGFTTLHSFTPLAMPMPQLTITPSGSSLIVAWPANTGSMVYSLESTTDLLSPSWSPVSFTSDIRDGMNLVNLRAGTQPQFFRLKPLVGGCMVNTDCPIGSTCVSGVCMVIMGGGGGGFGFGGFGFGFGFGFGGNGGGICAGCGG